MKKKIRFFWKFYYKFLRYHEKYGRNNKSETYAAKRKPSFHALLSHLDRNQLLCVNFHYQFFL